MIELLNCDCMEYMATVPDKYFDLAIVDPPYGIGDKFKGGKTGKMNFNEIVNKGWDKVPSSKQSPNIKFIIFTCTLTPASTATSTQSLMMQINNCWGTCALCT